MAYRKEITGCTETKIRLLRFVINGYFAQRIVGRSRDRAVDTAVHCSDGQLPAYQATTNESTLHTANYAQLKLRK